MNPYQIAQTRINQLVGVKPTSSKNTFKNTDMKATLYKIVFGQQDIYTTFEGGSHNELISKARAYYSKAGLIGRFYLDIENCTYQIIQ